MWAGLAGLADWVGFGMLDVQIGLDSQEACTMAAWVGAQIGLDLAPKLGLLDVPIG